MDYIKLSKEMFELYVNEEDSPIVERDGKYYDISNCEILEIIIEREEEEE